MRTLSEVFIGGEVKGLTIPGTYFRLLATSGPVDVVFYRGNAKVDEGATQVEAGYYSIPERGFDRVDIKSATAQTVKFAITRGRGGYDRTIGSVDVLSLPPVDIKYGAVINDMVGVTVGVTATALITADATRRALRVLNNGTADIYLGGAGVTTANGCIKLVPGALWVEDDAPGAAWYAISGTAGQNVRVQALT